MALGVGFEVAARGVERGVEPQAREDVGGGAVSGGSVSDAAGGEEREAVGGGEVAEEMDFAIFAAEPAALDFDEEAGVGRVGGGRVGGAKMAVSFSRAAAAAAGPAVRQARRTGPASSPVNAMRPSE